MMNKNEYFVEVYDYGELVSTTDFDDINSALRFYATSWRNGYHVELCRNKLDLDGNIIKTEKFKETWK
nr:MAG TPA: hypothetical protein [Caudoviricetes sp.]